MTHPSSNIPADRVAVLRKATADAEASGLLTAAQLDVVYSEGWFKLFVPSELGGASMALPEAVRLEEAIAWVDGSLGWVVTLCAGAGLFSGYLDKALAERIFADSRVCVAGSGQANGVAKKVPAGFEVSGNWDYSSGAPHATHFTANCQVENDGPPHTASFIFERSEVRLSPNWEYMGLRATAGHSFAVNRLVIPSHRRFRIEPVAAQWPAAIYRYPFLQLAEATIAANLSGMCIYFLDLATEILAQKTLKGLRVLDGATKRLDMSRNRFYAALSDCWHLHLLHHKVPARHLHAMSQASLSLAQGARRSAHLVYPYCGLAAAQTGSLINQVWRNIHTASQHTLLLPR